jgi:mannosyltransferase
MGIEERKLSRVNEDFVPCELSAVVRHLSCIAHYLNKNSQLATSGALVALALVAFLLRTPHLDTQSLWRDEVDVIRLASEPWPELIQNLAKIKHNGPLFYLLMRGWLRLVGNSEFALRYLPLCFGILTVPLIYRAGRQLVGRQAATMTAMLVAISPYLVWYSQDAKMYALVAALALTAITCQLEALARGQARWWIAFVITASLSLYIHLLSALMIPIYVAAFLLAWPRCRGRRWWGLASLGLLTLPYLPLAAWQLPLVLDTYETGHPFYPIDQMLSNLLNLYARGVAMVGGWVVVAAFVFAILSGVFSPLARDFLNRFADSSSYVPGGLRSRLLMIGWLLSPVAMVYLISLRAPVFEPRYLIFVAPAFYLLTGLGIAVLSRLSWTATGLALSLVLSFSLLGIWVQATTPIKSDFRAAAHYVSSHRPGVSPILFQMPYVQHTFDYYFDGDYLALEGPWTNDGLSQAQLEVMMAGLLENYAEVWLVASESWLWDSRDLTRAWLDDNADLIESANFALVDVYHYHLTNLR